MFFVFLFLLGLAVGSFLNVVIDRLPRGLSLGGRSFCEHCQHQLGTADLVPVFSWLWLRGRCRYCGSKISRQYPAVELVTGTLFAAVPFINICNKYSLCIDWVFIVSLLFLLFIFSALIAIFVIDLKYGIIPDEIVVPTAIVAISYQLSAISIKVWNLYWGLKGDTDGLGPYLLRTDYFRNHLFLALKPFLLTLTGSFLVALFFYLLIVLTRRRGMGFGDVKLGFIIGLISGFPGMIVAVFISFLTGAVVSVILVLMGKKRFGEAVPFGPFLVLGALTALFFGNQILTVYLNLL